jgi:hypothetical protein
MECLICGIEFIPFGMKTARYCSARCRQRKYRDSEGGKETTREYNKRYKRPDIEITCLFCGDKVITARANQRCCGKEECKRRGRSKSTRDCLDRKKKGGGI